MIRLLLLLVSINCFAGQFNCNLQLIPLGKEIKASDTDKYVLSFTLNTPITKEKTFTFKTLKITFYPLKKELISLKFEDTNKKTYVSTDYSTTQEIISLNTQDAGIFICWSDKAMSSATNEDFH
jgi:virulence-associated protein VapD